jgi:hypothetical protein
MTGREAECVGSILSRGCAMLAMERKLQCLVQRSALKPCWMSAALRGKDRGWGAVCISRRKVSSMTCEHSQDIDVERKVALGNFSTELPHPTMRRSVRRISVPSQTAEVSS